MWARMGGTGRAVAARQSAPMRASSGGTERLGVFGENKSNLGAFCTHSLAVAVMARRRRGKAGPACRAVSLGVLEVCKSSLVLYCTAATGAVLLSRHTVATLAAISIPLPSTQNHRREHWPSCPSTAAVSAAAPPLSIQSTAWREEKVQYVQTYIQSARSVISNEATQDNCYVARSADQVFSRSGQELTATRTHG